MAATTCYTLPPSGYRITKASKPTVSLFKRYNSGYALRFRRIVRIRDDKPPSEIDTLDAVKKLAEA